MSGFDPKVAILARRLLAYEDLPPDEAAYLVEHARPIVDHADGHAPLADVDLTVRSLGFLRWAIDRYPFEVLELELELHSEVPEMISAPHADEVD